MARIIVPSDLTLVSTNVPESSLNEYSAATTYTVGQQVKYTTGQPLPHHEFEALQSTTGVAPEIGGNEQWLDLGITNQHRMFDGFNNSKTSNIGEIVVTVDYALRTGFLVLLGMSNVQVVTVNVYSGTNSEPVWSSQIENTEGLSGPVGFWSYAFGDRTSSKSMIVQLPSFVASPRVEVSLAGSSGLIECSKLFIGSEHYIGDTEWGASPSLNNYSLFEKDEFGVTKYVPRQTTRVGDYTVWVNTVDFDRVYSLLESLLPKLFLFDGNDEESNYDFARVYGMMTKLSPGLSYGRTPIDIRMEGLE